MFENPPVLLFTCGSVTRYYECQRSGKKSLLAIKNEVNLSRGAYNGFISETTRKGLKKKLSLYYDAMLIVGSSYRRKYNICHPIITLTLPSTQMHDDNTIKRECLTRFVDLMCRKFDVRFYYWIAEKQKNGNIHFHVLADRFIEWQWVRKAWNTRLETLGYLDAFEQKNGHRNPNSTDIQMIRSLSKSSDYVTKYTSKADQQGGIQGRLHGECDKLKELKKMKMYSFSEWDIKLSEWIDRDIVRVFESEHAVVLYGNIYKLLQKEAPKTYALFKQHCRDIADSFYCPEALAERHLIVS